MAHLNSKRIPVRAVQKWARFDQDRWKQLIGRTFEHHSSGPLLLQDVRFPYLEFDEDNTWDIKFFSQVFSFMLWDEGCPLYFKQLTEEEEKQQLKIKKIKAWCEKHDLPEDEVVKLSDGDPDRARPLLQAYIDNKIIPRNDLSWLAKNTTPRLLEGYLKKILFLKVDPKIFSEPVKMNGVNSDSWWSIGALHAYERVSGVAKSDRSQESEKILAFKDGDTGEINRYSEILDRIIGTNVIVCCAPSSGKDAWGPGLLGAVHILGDRHSRQSASKLLRRTIHTEKRSSKNGNRSLELNLKTIEVQDTSLIQEKPVVVIDDVTTTGNTMKACSQKLWDAGANCVGAIALGRTP